jgi:hypothetical protein
MTNTQKAALDSAQRYREKMFSFLGDRDPLEVLSQTANGLGEIVKKHSVTVLQTRPFQGKWTANEVIGHLCDGEWVYGYRLRVILSEDKPIILGTNQDSWVASLRHNEREPSELVQIFTNLRNLNLAEWKRTPPADLRRSGQHSERGPESLDTMLRLLAGHDLSHLSQIATCIQTLAPPK